MMACGALIHEINAIRKHLSAIKGGGWRELPIRPLCSPLYCPMLLAMILIASHPVPLFLIQGPSTIVKGYLQNMHLKIKFRQAFLTISRKVLLVVSLDPQRPVRIYFGSGEQGKRDEIRKLC